MSDTRGSMSLRTAIREVYRQVSAPDWAAPNLDGLADVLGDLSWLPEGEVLLALPDLEQLGKDEVDRLLSVLLQAVAESVDGPHPVRISG